MYWIVPKPLSLYQMLAPNYPMLLCSYYQQEHSYLPLVACVPFALESAPNAVESTETALALLPIAVAYELLALCICNPLQQHEFE